MPSRSKKRTQNKGNTDAAVAITPYLYLGPRSSVTTAFLSTHGITNVLSIGATPACTDSPGVSYYRLSIPDDLNASIDALTDSANTIISDACRLQSEGPKQKILVHCSAAISRSPMVVAAYLVKMCGFSLRDALGSVVRARPAVCPNPGFVTQLKVMEVKVRGICSLEEVELLPLRKEDRLQMFAEIVA